MPDDAELDLLRRGVSCAAVLEQLGGWRLDRPESTRRALKYRRSKGEIIIVNHDGHGWWDPTGNAKGDVFDLVRRLEPGVTFGQVCQVLQRFVGVIPSYPAALRKRRATGRASPAERWAQHPMLRPGDPAWRYLAEAPFQDLFWRWRHARTPSAAASTRAHGSPIGATAQ